MHGTFTPRPPERRHPEHDGGFRLIARILLREAALGCLLDLLIGHNPGLNVIILTMAFAALLTLTNRHGLLRHRTRRDIVIESFAILMGGLAFRNVFIITPSLLGWH